MHELYSSKEALDEAIRSGSTSGDMDETFNQLDQLLADLSIHALDLVLSDTPISPGVKVRAFNHLLGECDVTVFATAAQAETYRHNFPRSLHDAPFLLPTQGTALRRSLEQWFEAEHIHPAVAAEVEDMALLQVLGQEGLGLFAAPTVVEDEIRRQYRVEPVGRIAAVRERFYAISIDRKLKHPAVLAISKAAKGTLFS